MKNTEHIKKLLDKDLCLSKLYSNIISKVDRTTVRTKGQLSTERFFYIQEGVQTFTLEDGTKLVTKKGDILYLPPDATYISKWEENPKGKAISIMFSMADGCVISDSMFVISNDKYGIYINLFLSLADVFEKGKLGYKIKGQSIFWEIYNGLLTDVLAKDNKDSTINKGILYIENNYMNEINVDEIAKMCFTSPATFRRKFKKITGMSPIEYKNMLKIKKASELLKTGEFSVSEAAKEVNIEDIYYFSKMFKKYMGETAHDFAKQINRE